MHVITFFTVRIGPFLPHHTPLLRHEDEGEGARGRGEGTITVCYCHVTTEYQHQFTKYRTKCVLKWLSLITGSRKTW